MKLVPTQSVRPSTYNPRAADPARLQLVELSLRKLGFLLPLYAEPGGEILSGHQRHLVAERMGATRVPVETTPAFDLATRKAINIAFNRATNDMRAQDTEGALAQKLRAALSRVEALAAALPDLTPGTAAFYPCLRAAPLPLSPILKANAGRWQNYARNMARGLAMKGIEVPLVVSPSGRIVNGLGRAQYLAERGRTHAPAVVIGESEADLAGLLLNLLTMDFDVKARYADLLRHNSFRRARRVRSCLGRGFVFAIHGGPAKDFDISDPAQRTAWVREHGSAVLDFGAGHLHETQILRQAGVDVTPFEPYRLGAGGTIDKPASLHLARQFLSAVAAGKAFTSIFISSVLNSVPFAQDRRHIACLAAALCAPRTRLYACASAIGHANFRNVLGGCQLSERRAGEAIFRLSYEPGILIGDLGHAPKVQKYHTPREFHGLFGEFFARVRVTVAQHNCQAVCAQPRPVDPEKLAAALAFEFDLPYPDGSRMGLAEEARAAFARRPGRAAA